MISKKVACVDKDICVACGACVKQCSRNSIKVYKGCYSYVLEDNCVGCGRCSQICPTGCITMKERAK